MNDLNSKTQLVVIEDDTDIQDLITAFFKPRGFATTCFSNAETALQRAHGDLKADVVIADFNLPGISGIEFLAEIKKLWPKTPVILITGSRSSELAAEAVEKGAYDFLMKPIHFPQLMVSVDRALHLNDLSENLNNLKELVIDQQTRVGVIGKSRAFTAAFDVAKRVAKSNANIFITGESGTGKEVIAKYIHQESKRKDGPFIAINCSAIPENLLESELFGHAKGAFTGAVDKKCGLFEEATNGTLFLDEIGDLSLPLQAKLLRVLQERKIKRVGENRFRDVNARIISATHKNLGQEISEGRFREDLFFRLNVIPIRLPTLAERKEDVVPLAEHFLKKYSALSGLPPKKLSSEAIHYLLNHPWRGNVRELENSVERAVVLSAGSVITVADLLLLDSSMDLKSNRSDNISLDTDFVVKLDGHLLPLQDIVQKYIEFAVQLNGGGKDRTARDLGIDRKTLYKKYAAAQEASSGRTDRYDH